MKSNGMNLMIEHLKRVTRILAKVGKDIIR
jgi:hypothetical protein